MQWWEFFYDMILSWGWLLSLSVLAYFSMLMYCGGGGGSVGLPLNMAFLLQSCKNFGPQKKFMYLINFNWYLTFFCNLTLKLTLGPKLLLYLLYVPQKKAKIIKKLFLNQKIMICFRKIIKRWSFLIFDLTILQFICPCYDLRFKICLLTYSTTWNLNRIWNIC